MSCKYTMGVKVKVSEHRRKQSETQVKSKVKQQHFHCFSSPYSHMMNEVFNSECYYNINSSVLDCRCLISGKYFMNIQNDNKCNVI